MSLSTLLEAAKYLDYLDSNNHQQQQLHFSHLNQPQQVVKKSPRRQRASKKNGSGSHMVAMSLPTSSGPMQMHGVPIPVVPGNDAHHHHQAASLSSSFVSSSPLSSFASTALFCSQTSGVTSNSSSAASSLSSSDSSSSCGEILMGDNDLKQPVMATQKKAKGRLQNNNNSNHHNYHFTHQFDINQLANHHQYASMHPSSSGRSSSGSTNSGQSQHQSIARYIASTSAGPQLVTMTTTTSPTLGSESAPIDDSVRAGRVINAAKSGSILSGAGTFDHRRHFSVASGASNHQGLSHDAQGYTLSGEPSFGSDGQLNGSPGSYPPMMMARVQPMILNSLSPSAQSVMAFQSTTASSPTSSSSSYSRHRELHKTLEKNRRAHLRHCFELLKAELPASECVDKKTSHINIIKSAIRYVLALRQQECEIENELQRLTRIKTELTENLSNSSRTSQPQQQQYPLRSAPVEVPSKHEAQLHQQPVAEQQLSLLLSQSKID